MHIDEGITGSHPPIQVSFTNKHLGTAFFAWPVCMASKHSPFQGTETLFQIPPFGVETGLLEYWHEPSRT